MKPSLIALADAVPGMVLAADLTDAQGSVLLPGGVALSAVNLASLRRRGIEHCSIVDSDRGNAAPDAADDNAAARGRERRLERLTRLFRASAGIGATALLLQLLIAYRREE
ncbi:MAG TPA: hypothetical protein VGP06_12075 [Janthinobacterium sp.]|jgi:hypothetical protein|nr:hypothetical protein [Janthinobacterium sp.]